MTGEKISWERDGSEMVLIPVGSFEMGDHHFNEESTDTNQFIQWTWMSSIWM